MKDNAKDLEVVQNRLVKVKSQIQEMAGHDEKHLRWALGIKIVLLAFITIYMGWAYVNFRIVDADLLVVAGQQKFYEALPDLKSQMINRLNALAPSIINQTSDALVKGVPKIERQLLYDFIKEIELIPTINLYGKPVIRILPKRFHGRSCHNLLDVDLKHLATCLNLAVDEAAKSIIHGYGIVHVLSSLFGKEYKKMVTQYVIKILNEELKNGKQYR